VYEVSGREIIIGSSLSGMVKEGRPAPLHVIGQVSILV
jgi:hypothetical protein